MEIINNKSLEDILSILLQERQNRKEFAWKTKDGMIIPVKELSDSHLNNIIEMVKADLAFDEVGGTSVDL